MQRTSSVADPPAATKTPIRCRYYLTWRLEAVKQPDTCSLPAVAANQVRVPRRSVKRQRLTPTSFRLCCVGGGSCSCCFRSQRSSFMISRASLMCHVLRAMSRKPEKSWPIPKITSPTQMRTAPPIQPIGGSLDPDRDQSSATLPRGIMMAALKA